MRLKLRQEKYVRIVHEVDQGKQIPGRETASAKAQKNMTMDGFEGGKVSKYS